MIACSRAGSASPFLKGGLVNIRLAVVLETTTTLGALSGVLLVGVIPTAYLFILFALILAACQPSRCWARRARTADAATTADTWGWAGALRLNARLPRPRPESGVPSPERFLPLGMLLMYGAGTDLGPRWGSAQRRTEKSPRWIPPCALPIEVSSATSTSAS